MRIYKAGDRVRCNGQDATVAKVCEGQLKGMVEVRMPRGMVCISLYDLDLDNPEPSYSCGHHSHNGHYYDHLCADCYVWACTTGRGTKANATD